MKKFVLGLVLAATLAACGQSAVQVQCPADSTCDVNVTPPPMTPSEIAYHQQQNDLASDVLAALILQDMMWRNCWNCYGPTYYSRYGSYASYTPAQRTTVIQQNTTVINNNKTVIQQASKAAPASAKTASAPKPATAAPAPAPKAATSSTSGSKPAGGGVAGGSSFRSSSSGGKK